MLAKFKQSISSKNLIDYSITFGVEFLIMVITIALFKLVGARFEAEGFSDFTISKRLTGFLMPLLMVGLGVALPKFLPVVSKSKQQEIYYTSIIVITILFIMVTLLFFAFPAFFSQLVFGNPNNKKIVLANIVYVYSLMTHACIYNFFRGKFNFKISSILQLINLGIIPLIMCFVVRDVLFYLLGISALVLIINTVSNLTFIPLIKLTKEQFTSAFKMLFTYGIQRMPGDVILGLFFALPTFIASNYFSKIEAGNIAFCLSLLNIIIAFMSPINVILLPKASKIVHEKDFIQLKKISSKLLLMSIIIGILSIIVVYFAGPLILKMFEIKEIETTALWLKIIFSGVIGYSIFSVIRSIIDAFFNKAQNTLNILGAFLIFIVSFYLSTHFIKLSPQVLLFIFSFSINMLGIFTFITLKAIHKKS